MARQESLTRLHFEAWKVGALRLTAFTDPLAPAEARTEGKGWQALVGKPPENSISRSFGTEHEESGPFAAGGKLIYRRWPRGVDWSLERLPDPDKPEPYFLMDASVVTPFKELMCRWLVDCPPLQRLAFGAALYLLVKDRPEAYSRLEHFLHLGLKYADDEGDFLYQYNRRRPSQSAPGVKINRVSKWTWLELAQSSGQLWPRTQRSACILELDVNTAPEFQGPLPRERYVPLFGELVALGEEIAERGDVP